MGRNFLIVAGDGKVREALASQLRSGAYKVTLAASGSEAERVAKTVAVEAAIVESHLPDMTGAELAGRLERARPDCIVTVISSFKLVRNTPALLRFGDDDYLMGSKQLFSLLTRVDTTDVGANPRAEQSRNALMQVIDVLVGLLELEHKLFASSSHQAMQLARATAEEMGANEELLHEVMLGALLRDVGRVGEEDHSLAAASGADDGKPDPCTEHVSAGVRLFEHIDFPWKLLPVIRHHHECYNGSGGPDGLRGREIPMGARIVAVVDEYVAMTCARVDAVDPESALAKLVRRAGQEFDPEVVEAFHRVIDKRLTGRQTRSGKPVVLVVEEQKEFRRLLKMRLINEGLEVDEVPTYERALERLLMDPPDLVLVDVDVDPTEAFQLLGEMQVEPTLCRTPIAFLSQRADRILRIRALRQGVDDFLSKSDDLEQLIARIQNILVREAIRAEGKPARARRGITGDLENLSLADIIQTLTIGMKTACVSVRSSGQSGQIWLENGTPTHAAAGDLEGEQAFFEMVRWNAGEFVIEHGVRSKKSTLEDDAMFLLMEGLRLLDESSEAAPAAS